MKKVLAHFDTRAIILLSLLIVLTTTACSLFNYKKYYPIKTFIEHYIQEDEPGGAVAVYHNGKLNFSHYYGLADIANKIKIDASTRFNLGSVTKHFTVFAILMLEQQDKLTLEDDIHKYIPELPDYGEVITINHMIRHTSGLKSDLTLAHMAGLNPDFENITSRQLLNLIIAQPELNFSPGESFIYSNSGYTLLAEIIRRVTKQSYESWMTENVFLPLEMTNTGFISDPEKLLPKRAKPYYFDGTTDTKYRTYKGIKTANGAGGLWSTIDDMAKWVGNLDTAEVGGTKVIAKLLSRDDRKYGMGLVGHEGNGQVTYSHSGMWQAYTSEFLYFLQEKAALLIVSNNKEVNAKTFLQPIMDLISGKAMEMPQTNVELTLGDIQLDNLEKFVGDFVETQIDETGFIARRIVHKVRLINNRLVVDDKFVLKPKTPWEKNKIIFLANDGKTKVLFKVPFNASNKDDINTISIGGTAARRLIDDQMIDPNLAGFYYNKAFDVTYGLVIKNDQLWWLNFGDAEPKKARVYNDSYIIAFDLGVDVRIVKTDEGNIHSLVPDAKRAQNIEFVKIENAKN